MIKKIGIVANPNKKKALEIKERLRKYLKKRNIKVITEEEAPRSDITQGVDLIITLGGDGTLLNIAKYIKKNTEILGVNVGGFGFLTEIKSNEVYSALNNVLNGKYSVSLRSMLKTQIIRDGKLIKSLTSLNDIVINRGPLSRILTLSVAVNDETIATYLCDGLIISTSTGSTAHSLSGGGPIVLPELDVIVITPICPHTLSNRPLVLPQKKKITIKLIGKETHDIGVTADGQVAVRLEYKDTLSIKRAPISLRLINSNKRSYFQILREKLKWGRLR